MTTTDVTVPTTVFSRDGTPIAFWTAGDGPPLLIVHGMTANHSSFDPLLPYLTPRRTVHVLDRRGRGASGDAASYTLEREYEDIVAVIDHLADSTGGPVALFGHSFGGLCAFGAALLTRNVSHLVLYEGWPVPDPTVLQPSGEVADRVEALLAGGDDAAALATFYREVVGMSDADLEAFRASPAWEDRVAAAATIPRELAAEGAGTIEPTAAAGLEIPVLLLVGSESPAHLTTGVEELAESLPDVRIAELEGQQHLAYREAPALLAQTLLSFLEPDHRADHATGG